MDRATTPTFEFEFPELISNYDKIDIAFRQGNTTLIKKKSDLTLDSGTTYYITLTQVEANRFEEGLVEIQVRVLIDDAVSASEIYRVRMNDVLNDSILRE